MYSNHVQKLKDNMVLYGPMVLYADGQLLGNAMAEDPVAATRLIANAAANQGSDSPLRRQMIQRFSYLSDSVKQSLIEKTSRLGDAMYYRKVTVAGGSTFVEIFKGDDDLNPGEGNIAEQKLEKDVWLLVQGLKVVASATADADYATSLLSLKNFRDGEFKFRMGTKTIFDDESNEMFFAINDENQTGYRELANPFMCEPQKKLEWEFYLAGELTSAPNTADFKAIMHGVHVITY